MIPLSVLFLICIVIWGLQIVGSKSWSDLFKFFAVLIVGLAVFGPAALSLAHLIPR